MIQIDHNSKQPIYEQMEQCIIRLIEQGNLAADEKLPSVRVLAKQLEVNPNTVQRVYSSLEQSGIVYSVPGKGSFVRQSELAGKAQRESAISFFEKAVMRLCRTGIDQDTALHVLQKIYSQY